jgi:hypothetical protein
MAGPLAVYIVHICDDILKMFWGYVGDVEI